MRIEDIHSLSAAKLSHTQTAQMRRALDVCVCVCAPRGMALCVSLCRCVRLNQVAVFNQV